MNRYYDLERSERSVAEGTHRNLVGGYWEEIGLLCLECLKGGGLRPEHRILDIGCGCLRVGVQLVEYLDTGNYYGTDLSEALLDAGYGIELPRRGLQAKLPRHQLVTEDDFSLGGFDVRFDFALASSLFTHLPGYLLSRCLEHLSEKMEQGGRLYATFFICEESEAFSAPLSHPPAGVVTHGDRDPFHYRTRDILASIGELPWQAEMVSEWNHPRGQRMVCFERL